MRVVEIRDKAGLQDIEAQWQTLLSGSASDTLFLTREWLGAWAQSYSSSDDLYVLAAFDDSGTLHGLAPLRRKPVRKHGQTITTLSFIGDGSNDSEYLDFIITRGHEAEVMPAFQCVLQKELLSGVVLLLNEIPEASPNLPFLQRWAEREDALWMEATSPCGTVRLPESWDEYLGCLKPRFRTKVRSVLRNLAGRPEVQFGFCESTDEISNLLPVLFDLHTKRWSADGKPGVFRWDAKRNFYDAVTPTLLNRGWLRFSWMKYKDRVVACQYGFVYNGVYLHLQEGYEPACEHWNVGIGLRAWTIQEYLKQGIREYDFLGGIGRHKTDWGGEPKLSKHIQIADRTMRNVVFCRAAKWRSDMREAIASKLPNKVLEVRRRWLTQPSTLAAQQPLGTTPFRSAAANCYLHLGFPTLVRRLRERYEVPTGGSLRKRTEPAARILYYHRINNEGDPFFPAHTIQQFEEQMRFVSQHYRVVSLSELLKRLGDGSPETLMAITFDDGYQDNYDFALPILERYGLPATIFLTTGSLDSGEPLWFEQLAAAAKRTPREFVDLEIDIPRRFWFRTDAERLASNDGIFRLLRVLPDATRRDLLPKILQALNAPDAARERERRMLTWDQVRYMKTRGIDFGGHTVTHPFLSKLTPERAAWEVSECKRRIEEELQSPVEHFAYPNGREEDIGGACKDAIRTAGYGAALTTIWGLNYRSTDRLELRRGAPWENSLAMFAWKLDWYQLRNA
jgi:peptidoglycan/xylan/chitin deacetylase (PgdA/CDA1 family)/CelD/BcsL family acetyltransferase involved in cellulose biosynthesis